MPQQGTCASPKLDRVGAAIAIAKYAAQKCVFPDPALLYEISMVGHFAVAFRRNRLDRCFFHRSSGAPIYLTQTTHETRVSSAAYAYFEWIVNFPVLLSENTL
jgi:hypothetical protein